MNMRKKGDAEGSSRKRVNCPGCGHRLMDYLVEPPPLAVVAPMTKGPPDIYVKCHGCGKEVAVKFRRGP